MSKSSTGFKSSAVRKTQAESTGPSLGVTGTRTGSANRGQQRATGSSFNKPKKLTASQMLEAENKKMEEKLKLVKNMME